MTARRVAGSLLVTVLIVGVAASVWWSRRTALPGAAPDAGPAQPSATAKIALDLALDSAQTQISVLAGTPVFFDVTLHAATDAKAITVGSPGHPWPSSVRLVDARSGQPLSWQTAAVDAPRSRRADTAFDGGPRVVDETGDQATVDGRHVQNVRLATSPETMAAVAPGTYEVRATLATGGTTVQSAVVTVVVGGASDAATERDLEIDRLAASASFYLAVGRADGARKAAEELTRREPDSASAWMLLGDALMLDHQPTDALKAFRNARANLPRRYDAPTRLDARIEAAIMAGGRH